MNTLIRYLDTSKNYSRKFIREFKKITGKNFVCIGLLAIVLCLPALSLDIAAQEKTVWLLAKKNKVQKNRFFNSNNEFSTDFDKTTGLYGSDEELKNTVKKAQWVVGLQNLRPFLRRSDGSFEAVLSGYIQLDTRGYGSRSAEQKSFAFRRVRLGVDGKVYRNVEFKAQADFSDLNRVSMRDVYVKLRVRNELQLWFGQMKEPWGQEELHGDSALEFVERSMVNNLTPARNLGIIVSGAIKKGVFEYQFGAFTGNRTLSRETKLPPEAVVRLHFAPWKNLEKFWTKGFSFGGAFAASEPRDGASVRGRSASRAFTFFKPDKINGISTRSNAELSWLAGPASFRAEYDQTNQARKNLGAGGANLPGIVAKGLMAQFTYLLTGETKPDAKSVAPRNNFLEKNEKGRRGFGAWELKFRYDNLQISDSTAKSNRADSIYFGTNWYLNRHVRYLLDFGFERFKDSARTPQPGKNNSFVMLSRIQFAL